MVRIHAKHFQGGQILEFLSVRKGYCFLTINFRLYHGVPRHVLNIGPGVTENEPINAASELMQPLPRPIPNQLVSCSTAEMARNFVSAECGDSLVVLYGEN